MSGVISTFATIPIMNKRTLIICIMLLSGVMIGSKSIAQNGRSLDIVLCMDLSASTNGLIEDLKERVWEIASEASKLDPVPNLRIALIAYSRPSYGKTTFYVKMMQNLTDDLDRFADTLIQIHPAIEAGDQYVGRAIITCINDITWSKDANALKLVFLVGNGTVDLGGNEYEKATIYAETKGILIFPLFCKTYNNPATMAGWKKIAELAHTEYNEITVNKHPLQIKTDFDEDVIAELNKELRATYVPYGPLGRKRFYLQEDLDKYAAAFNNLSYLARITVKSSTAYQFKNSSWDLVDLAFNTEVDYSKLERIFLPIEIRDYPDDKLKEYIEKKKTVRNKVVSTMKTMNGLRLKELQTKRKDLRVNENGTLGNVVINMMKKYAAQNGFSVPK